ncbi:hypothetical protein RRG08_040186 [Elysia crispata]|uniref:Uncharacterized protein n=1 Tax=Elysia crispata TaxID=231223 RepID=A0AAE1CN41_9GAST|nr:hypothetical protein RRG08_040186 [Elysia crispata]
MEVNPTNVFKTSPVRQSSDSNQTRQTGITDSMDGTSIDIDIDGTDGVKRLVGVTNITVSLCSIFALSTLLNGAEITTSITGRDCSNMHCALWFSESPTP